MGREIERVGTDGTVAGRFGYDAAGRLTSAVEPATGVTVEFLWDDDDRIDTIERSGRHAAHRTRRRRLGDRHRRSRRCPHRLPARCERPRRGAPSPTPGRAVGSTSWPRPRRSTTNGRRDRAGRLTIGRDGTVYRYDDVGRLAEIAPPDSGPTRYTYSQNGLLVTETGPARRAVVPLRPRRPRRRGRRRLRYAPPSTTTTTAAAVGRLGPEGSSVVYRWDVFDRLVGIDRYDALDHILGGVEVSYDALGRPYLVDGDCGRLRPGARPGRSPRRPRLSTDVPADDVHRAPDGWRARRRPVGARCPRPRPGDPSVPVARSVAPGARQQRVGVVLHVQLERSDQLGRPHRDAPAVGRGVRPGHGQGRAEQARRGVGSDQERPVGHTRHGRCRRRRRRAVLRLPGRRCRHPHRRRRGQRVRASPPARSTRASWRSAARSVRSPAATRCAAR